MTKAPLFNVMAFSLFWALQIVFSKLAYMAGAKAVPFTIQTAIVSLIFLTLLFFRKAQKELASTPKKVIGYVLLANAIHFGLGGFFNNAGISLTTAINAGFFVKFALVTTLILAWLWLKEEMGLNKILTAGLMGVGLYLITTKGLGLVPQIGDLLIILACFSWSIGNILIRKALKDHPLSGEVVTMLRPLAGLPVFLLLLGLSPFYPDKIRQSFQVNIWQVNQWFYVVLCGILVSVMWMFLNRTLKVATASYMTLMSMATPVFVAIISIGFLGETFLPIQYLGAGLVIISGIASHYLKFDKK